MLLNIFYIKVLTAIIIFAAQKRMTLKRQPVQSNELFVHENTKDDVCMSPWPWVFEHYSEFINGSAYSLPNQIEQVEQENLLNQKQEPIFFPKICTVLSYKKVGNEYEYEYECEFENFSSFVVVSNQVKKKAFNQTGKAIEQIKTEAADPNKNFWKLNEDVNRMSEQSIWYLWHDQQQLKKK